MLASVIGLYVVSADARHPVVPAPRPRRASTSTHDPDAGCSSASSSPSRSRRRCSRCTPGCPTPPSRRPPARACCWSACSTRSAPSGCCGSASGIFPEASRWATPVVVMLALISIVYGALVAIGQDDILRLIGLTSLSPLRLHRAGHLRVHQPGRRRLDPLHGQPRHRHRRAVPRGRLPDQAARHRARSARSAASRRSRRCWPGCSWSPAWPRSALPGLSPFVSEILVLIAAFQHHWWVGAIAVTAHRARRALHALDVPAHDDRSRPASAAARSRSRDLDRVRSASSRR